MDVCVCLCITLFFFFGNNENEMTEKKESEISRKRAGLFDHTEDRLILPSNRIGINSASCRKRESAS